MAETLVASEQPHSVRLMQQVLWRMNLRALPYAAICAFTDGFYGQWVQVEGPVDIVPLPEAMEPLVDYYRSISGEHPDWDDYRAAMERDRRVILRMTVERAGPDVSG